MADVRSNDQKCRLIARSDTVGNIFPAGKPGLKVKCLPPIPHGLPNEILAAINIMVVTDPGVAEIGYYFTDIAVDWSDDQDRFTAADILEAFTQDNSFIVWYLGTTESKRSACCICLMISEWE